MAALPFTNAVPACARLARVRPACKLPFLRGFHGICQGLAGIQRVRLTTTGPSEQPTARTENSERPSIETSLEKGVIFSSDNLEKTSLSESASGGKDADDCSPRTEGSAVFNKNGMEISGTKSPSVLESVFASSEGPKLAHPPSLRRKRSTNRPEKNRRERGSKMEKGKKSPKLGVTSEGRDTSSTTAGENFSERFVVDRLRDVVKSCKKELSRVGTEADEDVIHDLRVQLRRLRSALRMFAPLIGAPLKIASFSDLLRSLGRVRDTDVQQEVLSSITQSLATMSTHEQARVDATFKALKSARSNLTAQASAALRSKKTSRLIAGLEAWLANPKITSTTASGEEGVGLVVPSLLTPHAAALFLHPGWHVSSVAKEVHGSGGSSGARSLKWTAAEQKRGESLHDLRKHMRELRYHLELSKVAYKDSSDYSEVVGRIQTLQRLLGDLQDLQLLALSLQKRFGSLKKLPTLAVAIYKKYEEVWVEWKVAFPIVGSASGQQNLYCTVLKEVAAPP